MGMNYMKIALKEIVAPLILVFALHLPPLMFGAAATADPDIVVFVGVNVIPMDRERVLQNQTVIVRNRVIADVGNAAEVKVPKGATVVEAEGKYLIPGLADMHVHLTLATKQSFAVLIANGVTTVRDMGGDLKLIDEWRTQIEKGQLVGPEIYRAGPYVDGPKDAPDRLVVNTAQDSANAVAELKRERVDFIKIHNAVPRDAYFPLLEAAKKADLKVVGHIPMSVTPAEAVAAGQSGVEHMTSLIEGAVTSAIKKGKTPAEAISEFDDAAAATLFGEMAKNGVWMTPTLIEEKAITFRSEIEQSPDPRAKYVAASLKKYWYQTFTGKPTATRKLLLTRYFVLVRFMKDKHVGLLAGTDLGLRDIYPGFSLHDELELLVKAGLTPFEAIRTATTNPALFFGGGTRFGSIRKNYRADLVLLSADPTKDIRNIRKIEGVVLQGNYFAKDELEKMLEGAAAAAEGN
jgi:imidazolonepropionase-like amidohydrolase